LPPCDDVRGPLLHKGEEVGIGDLLLRVGKRDRLAVERIEGFAVDFVAEFPEFALESAPAGQLADRQLAAR
jgi:hypothetical protein